MDQFPPLVNEKRLGDYYSLAHQAYQTFWNMRSEGQEPSFDDLASQFGRNFCGVPDAHFFIKNLSPPSAFFLLGVIENEKMPDQLAAYARRKLSEDLLEPGITVLRHLGENLFFERMMSVVIGFENYIKIAVESGNRYALLPGLSGIVNSGGATIFSDPRTPATTHAGRNKEDRDRHFYKHLAEE